MEIDHISYLSTKLEARERAAHHGRGVFAVSPIEKGEVVAVWGGRIVTSEALADLAERGRMHTLQVDEGFFLAPAGPRDPADCVNHSCDPNAGMRGQITLVAMRDIETGEEVCYDYAMTESSPYDEFRCQCDSERCRERITAEDWRRPELWDRYEGYFSPYLQRRIDALRSERQPTRG